MALDQAQFTGLFETLSGIDLFGVGPPAIPWGTQTPTADAIKGAIDSAIPKLPPVYQSGYAAPFEAQLESVLARAGDDAVLIETMAGAIYDHGDEEVSAPLHRFLAVVSNFYRSFLSAKRRARADFPLLTQLPPLAMFQNDGDNGPFTIPSDQINSLIGSGVGVVSLPSVYREHPLLWASLAHETGGHDVVHADEGLLDELRAGVQEVFGGGPVGRGAQINLSQFLGLLWSFWMDEAVADVYGVMNIGPTFGHNLVLLFAAIGERLDPTGKPTLRTKSGAGPDRVLDEHPTDILRPHLIIGATESLSGLAQQTREAYVAELQELAELTGDGATEIELQGIVPTGPGVGIPVRASLPLDTMAEAARNVGSFIASGKFRALGDHTIQELETWDNTDEVAAKAIADNIGADRRVAGTGDDAELLAGATLALLANADGYDKVSRRLEEALDLSFTTDPIWGVPEPDAAFMVGEFLPADSPDLDVYITVTA